MGLLQGLWLGLGLGPVSRPGLVGCQSPGLQCPRPCDMEVRRGTGLQPWDALGTDVPAQAEEGQEVQGGPVHRVDVQEGHRAQLHHPEDHLGHPVGHCDGDPGEGEPQGLPEGDHVPPVLPDAGHLARGAEAPPEHADPGHEDQGVDEEDGLDGGLDEGGLVLCVEGLEHADPAPVGPSAGHREHQGREHQGEGHSGQEVQPVNLERTKLIAIAIQKNCAALLSLEFFSVWPKIP